MFESLGTAISEVAAEDLYAVSSSELGDDLVEIRRCIDSLEAEFSRRLARFDKTQGYAADGYVSLPSWLRHRCRWTGATATYRVRLARHLEELPQTASALARGAIGFQHVQVISRAAGVLGTDAVRDAEGILVDAAKQIDAGRLQCVTQRLRLCLDPDGMLNDANHDFEKRRLFISESLNGMYFVDGLLDPEAGLCLKRALDAIAGPRREGDSRFAPQVRADALGELARIHLDKGDLPQTAGQKPHLNLVSSAKTLSGDSQAGPAELDGAGPIHSETARRLACDAAVTPISFDENGRPSSAGQTRRVVAGALRRALANRDRGCRFPGCDRPPEWTDAHHIQHWAHGGETTLANTVLLCRPHHRKVHEGGWRLVTTAKGELRALPP